MAASFALRLPSCLGSSFNISLQTATHLSHMWALLAGLEISRVEESFIGSRPQKVHGGGWFVIPCLPPPILSPTQHSTPLVTLVIAFPYPKPPGRAIDLLDVDASPPPPCVRLAA